MHWSCAITPVKHGELPYKHLRGASSSPHRFGDLLHFHAAP